MDKYEEVFSKFDLNLSDETISRETSEIIDKIEENNNREVLKLIYSCVDYTSLNSDDSKESIWKFIDEINEFEGSVPDINNVAAVCVYPNFVQTVKEALTADVKIASVAGGFPSSQTFTEVKIAEIALALADGADEIDIVLNCGEFLDNNFEEVSEEIQEMKAPCSNAVLKVILEIGLLKTSLNIKKASILSIYSGADFIKTSTGKVYSGATPEAVYVMCTTIKEYYKLHNKKIGIKVAGGIKTPKEALVYYTIVKEILGTEWLNPNYFRIGASSLTDKLLKLL